MTEVVLQLPDDMLVALKLTPEGRCAKTLSVPEVI